MRACVRAGASGGRAFAQHLLDEDLGPGPIMHAEGVVEVAAVDLHPTERCALGKDANLRSPFIDVGGGGLVGEDFVHACVPPKTTCLLAYSPVLDEALFSRCPHSLKVWRL